ncbi:diguanylate cyclase [Roseospira marina]|uniref:diguanylate cyclase n=1 Tax=Roseospira marina TaxID=140057 RepID=A0A5M6I9B6_9PROT|nr:diguanylate cyclase [Roseospira marina]KAA5604773.1 diguanylate cyclase [Roseospira marina]MBB4313455.1 diguanylate cyclase (GGDEF)-like protein [Roseospira marina]MBB5086617.1 diguanylate cyclase (GGDEF)-like protein [Roseospira marina]
MDTQRSGAAVLDPSEPIEIADRVWWVGHYLEGDPFQCHVYLIERGDQSVLFDPGSVLTFRHTLRKIEAVTRFSNIRYFVCHHQDPDITGALPLIDQLVSRPDAVLVCHWRARTLVRHYGLTLPFWLIEDNAWQLDLGGRLLRFIFTPYAHFPGAFVTFDTHTRVLFSSDLFGGFTEGFQLFAQDRGYFENLRPFHEHYIPSRDVLQFALNNIEAEPIGMIAPQHGSIIPEPLVPYMIERLRQLDCGLFLLSKDNADIKRLMTLNQAMKSIRETMILHRDFQDIAHNLLGIAQELLPALSLEFFARTGEGAILHLSPDNRFRGRLIEDLPAPLAHIVRAAERGAVCTYCALEDPHRGRPAIAVPLVTPGAGCIEAVAVIDLAVPVQASEETESIIMQMVPPLQVAVERETVYRMLDMERQRFYETSIRDPLTNLFTRFYMQETVTRLMGIHDRDGHAAIALMMIDVDHFKDVNDTFGHSQGDSVLQAVAECLQYAVRPGDLPVRLGGEEFAVFLVGATLERATEVAERLRRRMAAMVFTGPMEGHTITASFGVALRCQGETLDQFLDRCDAALYAAKKAGRDRVRVAP